MSGGAAGRIRIARSPAGKTATACFRTRDVEANSTSIFRPYNESGFHIVKKRFKEKDSLRLENRRPSWTVQHTERSFDRVCVSRLQAKVSARKSCRGPAILSDRTESGVVTGEAIGPNHEMSRRTKPSPYRGRCRGWR
jgi:hypothetical protein